MTNVPTTLSSLSRRIRGGSVSLKPATTRLGLDGWFPYYAGYSATFVRETLGALGVPQGARVLDPWNGAGTTTTVADREGFSAIGFDINPVAAAVAAARLVRPEDAVHAGGLAREIVAVARRTRRHAEQTDPLCEWLSGPLVARFRSIEAAVLLLLGTRDGKQVELARAVPPPFAAFFLLCLSRAAKRFIRAVAASNPTWVTPERRGTAPPERLERAFLEAVAACARDMANNAGRQVGRPIASVSFVGHGDSRALHVDDASIDAVVTSPPYCTRVDYFRATRYELAALGIGPNDAMLRTLRQSAMGTNLVRDDNAPTDPLLPGPIRRLLARVHAHPSKASDTYYHRNFVQYFSDARESLAEIHRVLRPKSTAIIVVQSSYYKELPIKLGKLFAALGEAAGFEARVVCQVPVRRVLVSINPRASHHLRERAYTEDVVALTKAA